MSIFADEWRACLREQYKQVIRVNDTPTLESLRQVMYDVGFSDDELAQLRVEATMRADEVPDDFRPDLDILKTPEKPAHAEETFLPHPLECQCPACVEANLIPHDEDGQPIPQHDEDDEDESGTQQLSLF